VKFVGHRTSLESKDLAKEPVQLNWQIIIARGCIQGVFDGWKGIQNFSNNKV
jgi:hypothetical protein